MNIKWDAHKYTQNFQFVNKYGEDVLKLFTLDNNSHILDLGCGNGDLTVKIAEMGYCVTGVDDSLDMLEIAKKKHSNIEFKKGNGLTFKDKPYDGIFSNAVIHWIDKENQQQLVNNISANLRDGGEFVCEFGGYGCAETVHSTLREIFAENGLDYKFNFYFPTIGEYSPILENAGLKVNYAVLFDRPTVQQGENGLEDWIRMFNLKPFAGLSDSQVQAIIDEAVKRLKPVLYFEGKWIVDYVRIRFRCVKESEC